MINLLPLDEKKKNTREYLIRVFSLVFLLLGISSLIGYVLLIPSFFLTASKEALVKQERVNLESTQEYIEFDKLRKTVEIVNNRLEVVDRSNEVIVADNVLTKLLTLKTENVQISSLTYTREVERQRVDIRGVARTREDLVSFIQIINQAEGVRVSEAPVSNFVSAVNLPYVLQVEFIESESLEAVDESEI